MADRKRPSEEMSEETRRRVREIIQKARQREVAEAGGEEAYRLRKIEKLADELAADPEFQKFFDEA